MLKSKKPIAFMLVVILLLGLTVFSMTACDKSESEDEGAVLATVGETKITEGMVNRIANLVMFTQYGQTVADMQDKGAETIWRNQVLVYLCVEYELFKQHFEKQDKKILTSDVNDEIKNQIDTMLAPQTGQSGETIDMKASLEAIGVKRSDIEYWMEYEEYVNAFSEETNLEYPPSDEEIADAYEENKAELVTPTSIEVSHILMQDADHGDATRAAITEVLEKAKAGEDFAELAITYSEDGSAASGGALGWITPKENFVPEFLDAAFKLNAGEISEIVETTYGYHLIKVTDRVEEQQWTLEDSRDNLVAYVQNQHVIEQVKVLKETIGVKYNIDVNPETGEPYLNFEDAALVNGESDNGDGSEGDASSGEDETTDDGSEQDTSSGDGAEGDASSEDETSDDSQG
jgi:foldase protein PrsA